MKFSIDAVCVVVAFDSLGYISNEYVFSRVCMMMNTMCNGV